MLAVVQPMGAEWAPLGEALGRTLAAPVTARLDQPPFDASAMDGWAVRAEDGPGPKRIVGESAAGAPFAGLVRPGEAARIFTGAALPAGANAVCLQEDCQRRDDEVATPASRNGHHVRGRGQDFQAGDELLPTGARLDAWRLLLAAAAGEARVQVRRAPKVAILSTGDELVEPGEAIGEGRIFNSLGPALAGLVVQAGGEPARMLSVPDDADAIARAVAEQPFDLLVTVGGASVGDHDLVRPALVRLGLRPLVEGVAVRPGKPTWFGQLGNKRPILGLPGNPASALVCAELFLRPLIRALVGLAPGPSLATGILAGPLAANGGREAWLRATLAEADGCRLVQVDPRQDSSLMTVFAASGALVRRAAGAPAAAAGGQVEIVALDRMS